MVDPEHYPPKPGYVLFLRMGGWFVLILGVMLLVLSLAGQAFFTTAKRFEAEGRYAQALVVGKEITESRDSDGDRTYTYWLSLDFVTQRREEVQVRRSVGSGLYRSLVEGDEIQIRYLASEPDRVEVEEGSNATGAAVMRWMALVIGCMWLAALWVIGRWTVEALRARKYGKVEDAMVVEVVKTAIRVNNRARFRIVWKDAQGREGRSMLKKAKEVEGWHGRDAIRIYQGLKRSWWAGDIGDRPK